MELLENGHLIGAQRIREGYMVTDKSLSGKVRRSPFSLVHTKKLSSGVLFFFLN